MLEPDVSMLLEVEIFHLTNNGDVENDVNSTKIYRIKHAVSIFHFISINLFNYLSNYKSPSDFFMSPNYRLHLVINS